MLFKVTNVFTAGFSKIKRISRSDFMKIFTRFMFVNALIKVTETINETGGNPNTSKHLVKEIPLVLKIN